MERRPGIAVLSWDPFCEYPSWMYSGGWSLGLGQSLGNRGVKCWYRQSKYTQVCQMQLDITANSFFLIFSYPPVSIKAVGDLDFFLSLITPFWQKEQQKMNLESLDHREAAVPESKECTWWIWISDCEGKLTWKCLCHFRDNNSST